MASGRNSSGRAVHGNFSAGDKVEVLSSEEGFSDAWAQATVAGQCKGGWQVEYSKFVGEDGKLLREKVRPCRPMLRSGGGLLAHRPRARDSFVSRGRCEARESACVQWKRTRGLGT